MSTSQHQYPTPDFLLNVHLESAIHAGSGGITLIVGGTIITGRPVSTADFFRATLIPADAGDDFDVLRQQADEIDRLNQEVEELRDRDPESLSEEEQAKAGIQKEFVNLLDAHYSLGDGKLAPTNQPVAIRVRLSSVDAWLPGTMSND